MDREHGWIGRNDRRKVDVDVVVRRADGAELKVRLTNISPDGCRIEASELFRIGEHISIALPDIGEVRAQIRWALPGSAGTQFLETVSY